MTLTLGAAYLALAAHERNRQSQSELLRAQTRIVDALALDPSARRPRLDNAPLPSRAELAAQQRAHFVESAKDKWNSEIENAVRWAQSTDWDEVRETAEETAARLLGIARESTPSSATISHKAHEAQHTLAETTEAAKTRLFRAGNNAVDKAVEVQDRAKGAIASATEKGRHMVGKAKAAVHLAEEKIESAIDAKLLHVNEIEKALNERFEKPKVDPMSKSVEEVLAERYTPIDKRDNTRLRGI